MKESNEKKENSNEENEIASINNGNIQWQYLKNENEEKQWKISISSNEAMTMKASILKTIISNEKAVICVNNNNDNQ